MDRWKRLGEILYIKREELKDGFKTRYKKYGFNSYTKTSREGVGKFFHKVSYNFIKRWYSNYLDYMGEQIILTHSSLSKPKPKKFIKVLNQVIKLDGVNIWSAESDYEVDEFLEAIIQANLDGLNGREYIIK